jgi:hypothetical protein
MASGPEQCALNSFAFSLLVLLHTRFLFGTINIALMGFPFRTTAEQPPQPPGPHRFRCSRRPLPPEQLPAQEHPMLRTSTNSSLGRLFLALAGGAGVSGFPSCAGTTTECFDSFSLCVRCTRLRSCRKTAILISGPAWRQTGLKPLMKNGPPRCGQNPAFDRGRRCAQT